LAGSLSAIESIGAAANLMTTDEARRIAANIAKPSGAAPAAGTKLTSSRLVMSRAGTGF
jgi:hypothetical protein